MLEGVYKSFAFVGFLFFYGCVVFYDGFYYV